MAHQDFSQICPIFSEGVENELIIPLQPSITITAGAQFLMPWGREVSIVESYFQIYVSAGSSVSNSCTLQLFCDQSLSTEFASIDFGSTKMTCSAGMVNITASMTSSCAFTSTDYLAVCFTTVAQQPRYANLCNLVVRYKEK